MYRHEMHCLHNNCNVVGQKHDPHVLQPIVTFERSSPDLSTVRLHFNCTEVR